MIWFSRFIVIVLLTHLTTSKIIVATFVITFHVSFLTLLAVSAFWPENHIEKIISNNCTYGVICNTIQKWHNVEDFVRFSKLFTKNTSKSDNLRSTKFFYFQQKSNQIKSTKIRFVDHNIKIKIKIKSKRREVMEEERNRLIKDSHLAIKDKNKLALFVRIAI